MTLHAAFVGTGFIARAHAKALRQIPGVRIVAACSNHQASALAFAGEFGSEAPKLYESFPRMLEEARPDILYVCLPPCAHDGQVEQAARRGIHVFVEKPLSLTLEGARRMVDAVEASGVVGQVGFQMRFHPSVVEMKRRVGDGSAGKPVLFTGRYWTNMDGSPWWRDRAQSGGQMLEQAIHIYDLAAHLLGDVDLERAVGHVANVVRARSADYSIEDLSAGMLPLREGGLCIITACNAARPNYFLADFRCIFENCLLDYHSTGQPWITPDSAIITRGEAVDYEWREPVDLHLLENQAFLEAIQAGRGSPVPLRDGMRAMEWISAVQSAAGLPSAQRTQ